MIAFEELFPFGDLTRLLQQLQAEEKKLSSGRESFSQKYKETLKEEIALIAELKKQLQGIGAISLKGDGLAKVGEEVDKVGKKMQGYKDLINALTSAEAANNASVEKLRGTLAQLKSQYDKLDPTTADFTATQQELAQKAMYVKQAMESQLSTLKTAVKTVKQVENSYAFLNAETGKLRTQLKNLPNAFDSVTGAINKHNSVAVGLQKQIQANDRALKAMDANMGLYQRNVGNYSSALDGIKSGLIQFTGIATGVDLAVTAITKSFEVISSFERYRAVINFASKDTAEFKNNLSFLERIADSTGTEIEILYQKYASFAAATKTANLGVAQTQNIFGGIVKAAGALKMSNEALGLSLKAISDMLNKGRVGAEELRQQLGDHLPGAMQLFATIAGKTTQELDAMMKKGELLAVDILPKVGKGFDGIFGKEAQNNANTMSGSWNRLTNQLKLFIDEFAQQSKVTTFFATLNNGIADWLKNLRTAVNSNEWASFVAVLLGNPTATRAMVRQRFADENKAKDAAQQREVANNYMSKLTPQQREGVIAEKQKEFQNAAQLATSSQVKAREAQELLKILNIYKEVNTELKTKAKSTTEAAKATAAETDEVKKMRKEYNALRNELKESTNKNKGYTKTEEGATKLARYKELKAQLKDIDIAAGISNAPNEKIPDNMFESQIKQLAREYDKMVNEIGKAIENKTEVPQKSIDSWKKLYDETKKYADKLGVNVPENYRNLNNQLFPKPIYEANALTPISTTTEMRGKKSPKNLEEMLSYAVSNSGMDDYINIVKQQGFEVAKLQGSFSRSLRGLRKEEQSELISLKMQEMEFLKAGDEKRAAAAKAEYDATKERILAERDLRRQVMQEAFSLAQNIGQSIADIQRGFNDRDIERITKKKEFELSLVENNKAAQTAIEKKAAAEILEIRRKQAKQDKAAALFGIAVSTAQAVMSVLSTGGGTRFADLGISAGILTGLVIAQGLAQAAVVASKPLPEFAKGTQDAPEGPALVGEKGPELRKSGDKFYYHDKPTITNLKRGDKIFTATETARMFRDSMLTDRIDRQFSNDTRGISNTQVINYQLDTTAIVKGIGKELREAFGEQPVLKQVLDDDQISTLIQRKGNLTKYYGKKHF